MKDVNNAVLLFNSKFCSRKPAPDIHSVADLFL